MKFFMPVYAVALTLAVTSQMVEQASAATCTEALASCTATTCTAATKTGATELATTVDITKATTGVSGTTTCTGTAKAYIKSLFIVPNTASDTEANKVEVRFSKDGSAVSATATALSVDTNPTCTNTFSDIGKTDPTADVKVALKCAADCAFKWKAVYACQEAAACATTTTLCPAADATACPAVTTSATANTATSVAFTKPATGFTACADGKYAYLSKLTVFPDAETATLTSAADIVVRISKDGTAVAADATAVAKDVYPTCSNTYTDLGKDATKDLKVTIGCASTVTKCNFKYKAEWMCQAATTTAPAATTAAPSSAVSYPVAAWGTALVAAVAGANFAAPL